MNPARGKTVCLPATLTLAVCSIVSGAMAPGRDGAAIPAKPASPEAEYRIGPGDVLIVNVWKEPEASAPSVVVRSDGKISLPLVKEIDVLDRTPAEVEKTVAEKLSRFIHGAEVSVLVREIHSKKAYVIGAVRKEGPVPLRYRMSVLQALSEAGGINEYAKRKKIYVLRAINGVQQRFPFNYDEVIRGQRVEQNLWVQPEDTIVVPQ